jgi:hypothetical protein
MKACKALIQTRRMVFDGQEVLIDNFDWNVSQHAGPEVHENGPKHLGINEQNIDDKSQSNSFSYNNQKKP